MEINKGIKGNKIKVNNQKEKQRIFWKLKKSKEKIKGKKDQRIEPKTSK